MNRNVVLAGLEGGHVEEISATPITQPKSECLHLRADSPNIVAELPDICKIPAVDNGDGRDALNICSKVVAVPESLAVDGRGRARHRSARTLMGQPMTASEESGIRFLPILTIRNRVLEVVP